MRLKALDLFCGAGGASMGLHRAGFDVTGVDIRPQPRYPFAFHQADALAFPLEGFDFIWASPPCQAFTALRHMPTAKEHPNLIPETRARLIGVGASYCIENVPGAPLGDAGHLIMLCGTMFGLQTADGRAELRRHRLFEASFSIALRPACQHGMVPLDGHVRDRCRKVLTVVGHTPVDNTGGRRRAITITGHTPQTNTVRNRVRETFTTQQAREAMDIDWMPMSALSQAIPPAYSEWIGRQVIAQLECAA